MFGLISASECKILILFGTGAKNKSALVAGNPSARCRGLLGECHCCLPPPSVTDGLWISQLSGLVLFHSVGLKIGFLNVSSIGQGAAISCTGAKLQESFVSLQEAWVRCGNGTS